jgi:hypothetical protein
MFLINRSMGLFPSWQTHRLKPVPLNSTLAVSLSE